MALMPANAPEEIHALLAEAMNAGDLDAFIDLHEPEARTIAPTDGRVVSGAAELRSALEPIFALSPRIENEVIGKLEGDGLALTHARWALTASEPDGQVIELTGRGTVVSRRQADGSWRIVLENTRSPE
jgi:uncharacterized protein (TIGR02246 family)